MRNVTRIIFLPLWVAFVLCGCVAPYHEAPKDQAHAVLRFEGGRLFSDQTTLPLSINGGAIFFSFKRSYRISSGPTSLQLYANRGIGSTECKLEMLAEAGESYTVSNSESGNLMVITITNSAGKVVARGKSEKMYASTPKPIEVYYSPPYSQPSREIPAYRVE